MNAISARIPLPGAVLVAHEDLLRAAQLAQACQREGLTPLLAFSADDALVTLDRLELDAVVVSDALPAPAPGPLLRGVRRHTEALLILLGRWSEGAGAVAREGRDPADLRLDVDAPAVAVARCARSLIAGPAPARHRSSWGSLHVDVTMRQAWWKDVALVLTPQQFALLRRLVGAQGGVVTVGELAEAVYGRQGWEDAERIRAHVLRLRRRLAAAGPAAAAALGTVRGAGFRLLEPDEQPPSA